MATINPTQLIASLDPEVIRQRLEELSQEARALRVLLRASKNNKNNEKKNLMEVAHVAS